MIHVPNEMNLEDFECFDCEEERGAYCPPPEEIREFCAALQAGWSDRERFKRSVTHPTPWVLPHGTVHYSAAFGHLILDST